MSSISKAGESRFEILLQISNEHGGPGDLIHEFLRPFDRAIVARVSRACRSAMPIVPKGSTLTVAQVVNAAKEKDAEMIADVEMEMSGKLSIEVLGPLCRNYLDRDLTEDERQMFADLVRGLWMSLGQEQIESIKTTFTSKELACQVQNIVSPIMRSIAQKNVLRSTRASLRGSEVLGPAIDELLFSLPRANT